MARKGNIEVYCKQCNRKFYTSDYRIKDGRGKYCSKACYLKKQRRHYKKDLDPKEIVRLYVEERLPSTKIAKRFGCDYKRIYEVLKNQGVARREMSEAKKGIIAKNPLYRTDVDTKNIIEDYESGLSMNDIARKHKCSKRMVLHRLQKIGHKLRTSKHGQSLFLKGNRFPEWSEFMRKKIVNQYSQGDFPRQVGTNIELLIKTELERRGYIEDKDYIHQYKFHDKFLCDFVFPEHKLVVECDGDFWHANPAKYAGKPLRPAQKRTLRLDKSKEAYFKKVDNGSWTLLRLWGSEIRKDVKACVDRIEKVMRK